MAGSLGGSFRRWGQRRLPLLAGCAFLACFSNVRAANAATPGQSQVQAAPAKPAMTNAPAADTAGRYGKMTVVAADAAHVVKVKLPFPGAGEVKVPTPDELTMREKLESLAQLTDEEIHAQLAQWPAYGKMSLRDQGAMLQRIQDFRDYRSRTAMQVAHDLGLLALTPDQKTKFEKDYWDKRLRMDEDLTRQFGPIFNAREKRMEDELFREYSTSVAVQAPKAPGAVIPAPANKPVVTPAGNPPGNSPVAQSPR